jgi:5'-3' exonuclease
MLEGDKVDNITGINGIGKIKAARYIPIGQSNGECQRVVEEFYKKEFPDGWKKKFNANCELLWIWKKIPDECPFKVEEEEDKESAATSPL